MEEKRLVSEIVSELGSDAGRGLTELEAARRLLSKGPNSPGGGKRRAWFSVFSFLGEPMIWLLLGAAAIYFILGEALDAYIMLAAIVPIAAIDVYMEYRTESAIERLRSRITPHVRVLRNGVEREVDATEMVPGDVYFVSEGDVVPADSAVLEAADLKADESALSGESKAVDKAPGEHYSSAVFENPGALFAGSTVVGGRGTLLAVRTGRETEYGKIGGMISAIETVRTPLQKNIDDIVRVLGFAAIGLSMALFLLQYFFAGNPWQVALLDAVSLAIAAIPEEFPITFALFLSLGAWSLAKRNALVKKVVAVETLGSVNVICTDKTGTLTLGRMSLTSVFYGGELFDADEFLSEPDAAGVLEAAALACEKKPFDQMEKSIFAFVGKRKDPEKIQSGWELVREHSFDERTKHMSHVWRRDGKLRVFAKGAIEGILSSVKASDSVKKDALDANAQMAGQGTRVLALAAGPLGHSGDRKSDEGHAEFLALLGFSDPIRPGVAEAVKSCHGAGIKVLMITGDHHATAEAVARDIGMPGPVVMEGSELARLSGKDLTRAVHKANVFARVLPEHKLAIVRAEQSHGDVVAVTGDGINDAPALKSADIGVAMGMRGTEVARDSAAMVLLDDNFVTIVEAIRNGRVIYDNLRKAFAYLVAFHVPIFLCALVIPAIGLPLLLMPVHIILLELVLHPTVSIVFQQELPEEGVMRRKPRKRDAALVSGTDFARLTLQGFMLFALCLAAYSLALKNGELEARAIAFSLLMFGQVFMVAEELAGEKPMSLARIIGNRTYLAIGALTIAAWVALAAIPATQAVLKVSGPAPALVVLLLAVSTAPVVVMEFAKLAGLASRPANGGG
ncbi:MAG: cation-transporting P-type ATPase [Candidatus ainarchaeum sp.]|nr:cation-transporting P-type ATPase [Candidatus ainarchaeum sp.]